jgi:phosphatidylglycerophosphate synthase
VTVSTVQSDLAARVMTHVGPANIVTFVRAVLSVLVAGLVLESLLGSSSRPTEVHTLVGLSAIALVLDWVDGQVARRTHTESAFGARFDMAVDAFLILVLSAYVAQSAGPWVLAIGSARYLLLVAEQALPWLRRPTPARYWGKVVAAVQGIVLTVASADVLPGPATDLLLVVALALLAESFGRQVWWLWRSRNGEAVEARFEAPVTVLAGLLVWVGLTLPSQVQDLGPLAFVRLPLEALVLVALAAVLPGRARNVLAILTGVVLGLVMIARALDLGFYFALNRSFDPVIDWTYAGSLFGLLRDSLNRPAAIVMLTLAGAVLVALLVLTPLAVRRLGRLIAGHRRTSLRAVTVLAVVWALLAALGLGYHQPSLHTATFDGVAPFASASTAQYAAAEVMRIPTELADQREFARAAQQDPLRTTPGSQLFTRLRGKDVIVAFVESYGRSAVQGSSFAPGIDRVLDSSTASLRAHGFGARSAFLTSPTFGAISWLAHSTFQSGLWVDSQQRYDALLTSRRSTLSRLFGRAGWRTVSDIPANTHDWPQGAFYGYDQFYDSRNVGYRGPGFGYPTMPDQYTLDAFHRLELAPQHRKPVMAEIDLLSSHAPWSRTPRLVAQSEVGDGSVFDGMPSTLPSKSVVWRSPSRVRAAYGQSIEYSLRSLVSFVEHYGNDNTVLLLLGDHQPATIVSGQDADHDVPISVVAHDPSVLAPFAGWGWQDGLRPSPDAPVARMDTFRDRFVTAFSR